MHFLKYSGMPESECMKQMEYEFRQQMIQQIEKEANIIKLQDEQLISQYREKIVLLIDIE